LQSLPVIMVSYRDREEDRQQGLRAGANFYLMKSNFQDDTLIKAVRSLLG
jgi:two-component system sensor histidine kinase and response regulator WspE